MQINYMELLLGLALTASFSWALVQNLKRRGWGSALIRIDTLLGIVAGVYVIFRSIS